MGLIDFNGLEDETSFQGFSGVIELRVAPIGAGVIFRKGGDWVVLGGDLGFISAFHDE